MCGEANFLEQKNILLDRLSKKWQFKVHKNILMIQSMQQNNTKNRQKTN